MSDLYFEFNEMNLQLQGDQLNLIKTKMVLTAFIGKLAIFGQNLGRGEYRQFPNLNDLKENGGLPDDVVRSFCDQLSMLHEDMCERYKDILSMMIPDWVLDPFTSLAGVEDVFRNTLLFRWYIMVTSYTAVGIGITTMCIDLVGTRYITKLHYFGRKLKGADLMRYLRRKRIRDSRILLAAQAAETIEVYLKRLNRSGREESALTTVPEQAVVDSAERVIEKMQIAVVPIQPATTQHTE
ncbi:hypothetical protein D918_05212 [Trichuris suis]|nr:hypothetical protein D918_05212 [Trichuris suis]